MSVRSVGNPAASFRSRFGRTGNRASTEFRERFQATGGTTVDSGGYRIHIFTTSSTPGFNITSLGNGQVEVLVVGGGAGGGGGGGGAGGLRNFPYTFTATGSYPITVGAGAAGGTEQPNVDAGDGNPSFISGPGGAIIFATGGGGGGMHDHAPSVGQTGGSGGGSAAISPPSGGLSSGASTVASPDGITPTVQGYPGGGAFTYAGGNGTSAGAIMAAGEIYGLTYDVDNNYFALYKNGIILTSSSSSSLSTGTWLPYAFGDSASGSHTFNFGQKPFKFPPPAGFQPLALANTPRPTIVRPDQYVGIVTYTGNDGTQSINVGWKPDLVWIKCRSNSFYHRLYDTVRGTTKALYSNTTETEGLYQTDYENFTAFNLNGFSLGTTTLENGINKNNSTFVAWAWKAGGNSNTYNINDIGYSTASAAGLTAGTITPTGASVNTKSGFSIVSWTGAGSIGDLVSVPHGLQSTPAFVIVKSRSNSDDWYVWHKSFGNLQRDYIRLNTTGSTTTALVDIWGNGMTSSTTGYRNGNFFLTNWTMVTYAWTEIPGFSKFGSFTGNNSTDGVYVHLGFRPKFLLVKCTQDIVGDVEQWIIRDSTRSTYNPANANLYANLSNAEDDASGYSGSLDLLSNGFKMRGTYGGINASATYIYAAWAEAPSFNLYGGQANAR